MEPRIKMEDGSRITLAEYHERTEAELRKKELLWQNKLKDQKILKLLQGAKEVLERRLRAVTAELAQLIADDEVLYSVWEIDRSGPFEGTHHLVESGGSPFNVYPHHHRQLREKLTESKQLYEQALKNLKKLLSGKFGKAKKVKLEQFVSPL